MAAYELRKKEKKNYRELADVQLPRPERIPSKEDTLYPIEILERTSDRVKIHWIGYDSKYDEWRNEGDIESIAESRPGALQIEQYRAFDFHRELAYAIKAALRSSLPRRDPEVRLEVPFDLLIYNGGLKAAGTFVREFRGHQIYGIKSYSDLTPLLGKRWYLRVLNKQQDFCAIKLETVLFYIHRRADLIEFSAEDGAPIPMEGGYVVVFKFVRVDGVRRHLQEYLSID